VQVIDARRTIDDNGPMKILYLHGWHSVPGGVKPTLLAHHGHEVINPKLPDEDFTAAVKIAQEDKPIMITPPSFEDVVKDLNVNILAYNSSFYYVIVDAAGLGEQVYRFPVTGSETVLDGISLIGGLQAFSSPKRIWVARKNMGPALSQESVLIVDWKGITQAGEMNTNWQVMPGDRIYVKADPVRRFNNNLAKFLEPVKEVLGVTLLGSQTVNSIKNGTVSGQ
jgi:hypothetical protein